MVNGKEMLKVMFLTILFIFIYVCRNRPSHPVVYTTNGTLIAAAFSGKCVVCKNMHHTSYYQTTEGQQYFYPPSELHQLYFQPTAQTGFGLELLKQLTAQITFSACTFESQAEVYNSIHGHCDQERLSTFVSRFRRSNLHSLADGLDWKLNVTRHEDGWFLQTSVYVC